MISRIYGFAANEILRAAESPPKLTARTDVGYIVQQARVDSSIWRLPNAQVDARRGYDVLRFVVIGMRYGDPVQCEDWCRPPNMDMLSRTNLLEIGQQILPPPARISEIRPIVVISGRAAVEEHAIDHRASANNGS